MASSGGNWHSKKSGARVFVQKGEGRAKASARSERNSEREFKKVVGEGLRKREAQLSKGKPKATRKTDDRAARLMKSFPAGGTAKMSDKQFKAYMARQKKAGFA